MFSDGEYNPPPEMKKESVDRDAKRKPLRKSRSSSRFVDRGDSSTSLESDNEGQSQRGQSGRIESRNFTAHLSAEMVEPTREFLKALPDHKNRAQARVRDYKTRAVNMGILKNEILPLVPLSEDWTQEDRDSIRRQWRNDPTRERQIETKTNKEILTLTKSCLHFFRCLPEHILSNNDMEYDMEQNNPSKDGSQTLIWSAPFCKEMHALLPHPMFAGNTKLLATALQYVVMVETDDRRCWRMKTPVWDEFPKRIQALSRAQQTCNSRKSIIRIRKQVKKEGEDAGYAPSHWNMLFERVEHLVERAANKKGKKSVLQRQANLSEDPFQPYKVHRRHLLHLKEALDQMGPFGFPAWMSTALTAKAVNGSRSNDTFPVRGEFATVRDRMFLHDMEHNAHQAKLAAKSQGEPTPDPLQAQSSSSTQADRPSQVIVPGTQQISKPGFKPSWGTGKRKRGLETKPKEAKRLRTSQSSSIIRDTSSSIIRDTQADSVPEPLGRESPTQPAVELEQKQEQDAPHSDSVPEPSGRESPTQPAVELEQQQEQDALHAHKGGEVRIPQITALNWRRLGATFRRVPRL